MARLWTQSSFNSNLTPRSFGIIRSGTSSGIYVGNTSGSLTKLSLYKYDGTTTTLLASEGGTSVNPSALYRLDLQIVNFGASATINVYLDGALLISWSGNASLSGISDLDTIINTTDISSTLSAFAISEVLVTTTDTRTLLGVKTIALTSFGTTHDWTGTAFSDINGTSFSDTNPHSVNIVDKEQQFNVTDMPTGVFDIAAIKVSARMARSSGSTPTSLALGYNDGGSVTLGSDISVSTAYANYAQYFSSSLPVLANMNALQIEAKSRT